MALFSECMPECTQKLLDTADIVRDRIFQQLRSRQALRPWLLAITAHQDVTHFTDMTRSFV
jgi:hypothetical protein